MSMPRPEWYLGLSVFLGMWMTMMVPMMLPSLVPMVLRYRRSVSAGGLRGHGLTALVGAGYFLVWAGLGVLVHFAEWAGLLPAAADVLLLTAGAAQLTRWKARQLAFFRGGRDGDCRLAATVSSALRHGLGLGLRCSRACGPLMLALLATGMMRPLPMAAVTIAITAERLAPAPLRVARLAGLAILVTGLVTVARR
jgi:predicted metal-binding membrane protein